MPEDQETLEFSFDNVSDVKLPPTGGIRELLFDEPPFMRRMLKSKKDPSKGETNFMVVQPKINDGGKGIYPVDEQGKMVYIRFDMETRDGQTDAKGMFLAAGIPVPQGSSFVQLRELLKGKTARAEFQQSNGTGEGGMPAVYFNFRKWIIDAAMITNAPGKTPAVPQVTA